MAPVSTTDILIGLFGIVGCCKMLSVFLLLLFPAPCVSLSFSDLTQKATERRAMAKFDRKAGNIAAAILNKQIAKRYELAIDMIENGQIYHLAELDLKPQIEEEDKK